MDRLSVTLAGLGFEHPFILSASPCTDHLEQVQNALRAGWAGAQLKTTHVASIVMDPVSPRIKGYDFEDKKMVGLGTIDIGSKYPIEEVEERVRQLKKEFPNKIIIGGADGIDKETWQEVTSRLVAAGADAIECTTACPQGKRGLAPGEYASDDPQMVAELIRWVKEAAGTVPVFAKLAGDVDVVANAKAIKEAGGQAVNIIGVYRALMGIDLDTFVPYPSVDGRSTYSGYSGPATKPLGLRCAALVAKNVDFPIVGGGGCMTWRDALESMLVGVTIVEFASSVMRNGFRIIEDILDGVNTYLEEKNISNISELIGKALPNIIDDQYQLSREYRVVSSINEQTCVKDDICYISCRDGGHMAIELGKDRMPKIDEDKCEGCGLCESVCPVPGCITYKPKAKKPGA